ncbi:MAG: hypothetical protein ACRD2H_16500 [Terriglobales bacterium]
MPPPKRPAEYADVRAHIDRHGTGRRQLGDAIRILLGDIAHDHQVLLDIVAADPELMRSHQVGIFARQHLA